ncbi:MAG: zinc ribbon domain-containing protein [Candidatus Lokiarchaeota archaeon]|nr:zinc ribbon domain-containing protein [Candidatus Lokiarchaeota archaeon]
MEKNWFFKLTKSKIVIFLFQIVILSLIIYCFDYKFNINFDTDISIEHKKIIQFLANYIMFDNLYNLVFIYSIWIIVSQIPIFIFNDYKKAYSTNLTTFFFPNFFFYVFLRNHYRLYFNANFLNLFIKTIILGIFIVSLSIVIALTLQAIIKPNAEGQYKDLQIIASKCKSKCPKCGTEFKSIPQFCYNCNTKLIANMEDNIENAKL